MTSVTGHSGQVSRAHPLLLELMLDGFSFPDYIPHPKRQAAVSRNPSGEGIPVLHE